MINPAYFTTNHPDGAKRNLIIEPILKKSADGIKNTNRYKLYKSSIDNESSLFTEILEIDEKNDDLPDEKNPDFLGDLTIEANDEWHYNGDILSVGELKQILGYIKTH